MSIPAPTAERRRRLHRRRQSQDAADARQLWLHRDARDEQPDRSPRPAGLARLRSRSVGRICLGRACGAAAARSARGSRARVVSSRRRVAAACTCSCRCGAARRRIRFARTRRRSRASWRRQHPKLVTVEARKAKRRAPGLSRYHAQRRRTDDRPAVLGALAAACAGIDAARLGRGQPATQPWDFQHQNRRAPHGPENAVGPILRQSADAAADRSGPEP